MSILQKMSIFASRILSKMKRVILLLYFIFPLFVIAQEGVKFEEGSSFNDILIKAQKEKKLIFLDAYAAWCGPCKLMEKNVFTHKEVADFYNKNFINAHFDMEKGEGRQLAQKYSVYSYPTLLFINAKGEVVSKSLGYLDPNEFLNFGKQNSSKDNQMSLKERFEKGEKDPNFLLNVMKTYVDSDYELAKKASERYFEVKNPAEYDRNDVGLLLYFIKSDKDKNFKIFQSQKTEILKFIPEDTYKGFENNIKLNDILQKSLDEKNGTIDEEYYLKNAIPIVGKEEATKVLNQLKVNFYLTTKNFPEYEKAALTLYQDPNSVDAKELLMAAWVFSENIKNPTSLKKAQIWAAICVMRNETAENTYILAKLYAQTGNNDLAKMYAETSKRLAEEKGADTTLATQLLKQLK